MRKFSIRNGWAVRIGLLLKHFFHLVELPAYKHLFFSVSMLGPRRRETILKKQKEEATLSWLLAKCGPNRESNKASAPSCAWDEAETLVLLFHIQIFQGTCDCSADGDNEIRSVHALSIIATALAVHSLFLSDIILVFS